MKLIADSGSTKTEWAWVDNQGVVMHRQTTEGINPVHQQEADIRRVLQTITIASPVDSLHFYGSGIRPELRQFMRSLLGSHFGVSEVEAESDLLGAARALCGQEEGIACILGTGSNSCLYNGREIVANTPSLGYILGDEGSGAFIGRNFLNAMYKGRLPKSLQELFEQDMKLSLSDIISHVYRQPMANRWLASLTRFIYRYTTEYDELSLLVTDCFGQFLRNNVLPYQRSDLSLSATGSVAWYFQTELAHAASLCCLKIGKIEQAPMQGLISYTCMSSIKKNK